jgi:hypothetical protein
MLEASGSRPPGLRRFAATCAALFVCLSAWSLAIPMYGSADEQVHMVTAYAVVHRLDGQMNEAGRKEYWLPAVYTGETICYAFQPERSASCQYFDSDAPDHAADTTAWNYPPFYYLLVGWPTLFTSGLSGLYLMRLVASMWAALLLALALQNLETVRARGPLLLGAAIAITPAVLSFGGAVNPTGMSLAAALAVWTGGIALVRTDHIIRPAIALSRVGAPLCLFLLLRRDTVLWAGLIALTLAAVTPRERLREIARTRLAWIWSAAVAGCAALQLILSGGSTATSFVTSGGGSLSDTWNELPWYIDQIGGGILGWLDTRLPPLVYDIFTYGPALLAVLGICLGARRLAVATAALTGLAVSAPLGIGMIRYGYVQGRYILPLALGIPLLGGLALAERLGRRRVPCSLVVVPLVIIGGAHVAAFAQVMRRFTAGAHGAWWFWERPPWEPPLLSPTILLVTFTLGLSLTLAQIYRSMAPRRELDQAHPRVPDSQGTVAG